MHQDPESLDFLSDVVGDGQFSLVPQHAVQYPQETCFPAHLPVVNPKAGGLSNDTRYHPSNYHETIALSPHHHAYQQLSPLNTREALHPHYPYRHAPDNVYTPVAYSSSPDLPSQAFVPAMYSSEHAPALAVPPPVWNTPILTHQQPLLTPSRRTTHGHQYQTRAPYPSTQSQPQYTRPSFLRNAYPHINPLHARPVSETVQITIPVAGLQALASKKHAYTSTSGKSTVENRENVNPRDSPASRGEEIKIEAPVPVRYHEMNALLARAPKSEESTVQNDHKEGTVHEECPVITSKDSNLRIPSPDTLIALTEPYLLDWCFDDERIKKLSEMKF
ncbi:hypothetical protein VNI00_005991 [Paramarasmius palmivorus]|uniref:Uncharacterized protein n=1 Tax=Paramarasmius palmivorus TaxID=297713 RepID=A0AAW0DAS4_9AGAR